MRVTIVAALFLALGCAKKPPGVDEDIAKVCKHITDVCGELSNFGVCVQSVKAMRETNVDGAREMEECALSKTECRDVSMCTMKHKKVIRIGLRDAKEKIEKEKKQLDPPPPPETPAAPAPAAPPAK